jgi:hypothetical protein
MRFAVWILSFLLMAAAAVPVRAREAVAPYRTGQPDPKLAEVPGEIASGIFTRPEEFIQPLVEALTRGITDKLRTAKILHDWVAVNISYDVETFRTRARVDPGWATTLRRKKAVCDGYARLMVKLCELAGIEAVLIPGNGRGDPFQPDQGNADHAWNAVHIGADWYLMDVTWDSGHLSADNAVSSYRDDYLLLEPEAFLYTHFPEEARWQLLTPARSAAEWGTLPFLGGKFFGYGMRLSTQLARPTRTGASLQFTVEASPDVLLMTKLMSGETEVRQRSIAFRDGSGYRVYATFPSAGTWSLLLCCKRRTDPGSWEMVAHLGFESTAGTNATFPAIYPDCVEMDARLDWPLFADLASGQALEFQLRLPRGGDIFIEMGDHPPQKLQPLATDRTIYRATATVTVPSDKIMIVARPPGTRSGNVLLSFGPPQ